MGSRRWCCSALIVFLSIAACGGEPRDAGCPQGRIATADGCLPIPRYDDRSDEGDGPADAGFRADAQAAPDAAARDAAPIADAGIVDASPPDTGPSDAGFDLSGAWALEVINTELVTSNLAGTERVTVTTRARVEATHNGAALMLAIETCDVQLSPFGRYTTTYPAAAIAAIGVQQSTARLDTAAPGARFTAAQRVTLLGWRASFAGATEPLPMELSDPRIIDQDLDNQPGVTLRVTGPMSGDLYVVTRSIVDLEGTVADTTKIEGSSRATRAQYVLDSSNPLLGESQVTIEPDTMGTNVFRMLRIPTTMSSATCADAIAALAP